MQLEDWLDDLCVRFIINLPPEELASVERICFQIEEAQWFYEDFVRPLEPSLPSLGLRPFYLRITQRCPLFREWSGDHHAKAFEQFLAYKQRVPVRGAIMLNDKMDEVVLVKGWKKGANWSFPRGKINKGENDLDCAIREVYEETGFDIREAGLVKPEKKMKYIEVTMREQHMRLYVFRDVPKDTHFEPRTRKEISKIEWYKLTDLPTLTKKHHQQEGTGEHLAIKANKFYMVAPFVHPLKKWIVQEKKKDGRRISNLAAPPILAEETVTEDEPEVLIPPTILAQAFSPPVPSSLPEVSKPEDPLAHLKAQLNMPSSTPAVHVQNPDFAKSNALLNLLRNGSAVEPHKPHPQFDPRSFPTDMSLSPQKPYEATRSDLLQSSLPPFQMQPQQPFDQHQPQFYPPLHGFSQPIQSGPHSYWMSGNENHPVAPYQQTGEAYMHASPDQRRETAIPSANALPKLTHHTKALLDAFKSPLVAPRDTSKSPLPSGKQDLLAAFMSGSSSTQAQLQQPSKSHPNPMQQSHTTFGSSERMRPATSLQPDLANPRPTNAGGLLDLLKKPNSNLLPTTVIERGEPNKNPADLLTLFAQNKPAAQPASAQTELPQPQSNSLLDLLRRSSESSTQPAPQPQLDTQNGPVELSAMPSESHEVRRSTSREDLLALLGGPRQQPKVQDLEASKAGHTGATLNAPLNLPEFDAIQKAAPSSDDIRRSPVGPNRKLFDPKTNQTKPHNPVKVLARPEETKPAPKSPRTSRAQPAKSPKRVTTSKDTPKTFHPQILKRPQTSDPNTFDRLTPSPSQVISQQTQSHQPVLEDAPNAQFSLQNTYSRQPDPVIMKPDMQPPPRRTSQHTDSHKQGLLSLLRTPAQEPTSPIAVDTTPKQQPQEMIFKNTFGGTISPLSASQMVSPTGEGGMDPPSLRSRISSLASTNAGLEGPVPSGRPSVGKRQTAEGDKVFLLNYLGKIASQDAA